MALKPIEKSRMIIHVPPAADNQCRFYRYLQTISPYVWYYFLASVRDFIIWCFYLTLVPSQRASERLLLTQALTATRCPSEQLSISKTGWPSCISNPYWERWMPVPSSVLMVKRRLTLICLPHYRVVVFVTIINRTAVSCWNLHKVIPLLSAMDFDTKYLVMHYLSGVNLLPFSPKTVAYDFHAICGQWIRRFPFIQLTTITSIEL